MARNRCVALYAWGRKISTSFTGADTAASRREGAVAVSGSALLFKDTRWLLLWNVIGLSEYLIILHVECSLRRDNVQMTDTGGYFGPLSLKLN